ncbi:MAG: YhgE/Pip domain-containing protein [Firmicutes bacterium]|nr:YhgE/Pip domain-containing protein [Bacillota bacterium]
MHNILTIIKRDIKALLTHFFPLVIAIGLCMLPPLYAWFNIYSNWDPYGNSSNVKIAVASEDVGWTDDETGESYNAGDDVIDSLKENNSIDWVILDSSEKAVDGVKSGAYYAAVVLSDDFSRNMYHGFMDGLKQPTITYYENEKKNAVAAKITDTAVSTLKNSIDQMYVEIVVSTLFEDADKVEERVTGSDTESGSDSDTPKLINTFSDRIDDVNENIKAYKLLLTSLTSANERLNTSLQDSDADLDSLQQKAGSASDTLSDKTVSGVLDNMNKIASNVDSDLSDLQDALDRVQNAADSSEKQAAYAMVEKNLRNIRSKLNSMIDSLSKLKPHTHLLQNKVNRVITKLQSQVSDINKILDLMDDLSGDIDSGLSSLDRTLQQKINRLHDSYNNTILPAVEDAVDTIDGALQDGSTALGSISEDIAVMRQIVSGTRQSVTDLNGVMSNTSQSLDDISKDLDDLKNELNGLTERELLQKILDFMHGDPEGYGKFLAEPVGIESEAIYPVENYGSGVAPFYTTLALWVGCIFLLALMKITPSTEGLKDPRPYQLFFGRFGILFLLGQLQWIVIYIGNIYVLKTQCLHPGRMFLTGAVTSFTFMLLCYAVTLAFADLGKAIIVVIVVLQIAGSSGTYPIEVLPEFFQKVYVFFPFPYAINAMRECMFGYYENDYIIYMLQLLAFAAAALLLGLVIRMPFINVKNFMQQRMKDTGMM